jgi:hypothetical protein
MPLPSAEMIDQAHALLSQIEKNPQARSPEAILLALIYEELKKLNRERGNG